MKTLTLKRKKVQPTEAKLSVPGYPDEAKKRTPEETRKLHKIEKEKAAYRRQKRINEIKAILEKKYPNVFSDKLRPFKIGILEDIWQTPEINEVYTKTDLRRTMETYGDSTIYLESLVEGIARVDLDGNEVDKVTLSQQKVAQRRLKEKKRKGMNVCDMSQKVNCDMS